MNASKASFENNGGNMNDGANHNHHISGAFAHPWPTLKKIWRETVLGFCVGAVLAVLAVWLLPNIYEARMTVSPAGAGSGADLSAFVPHAETPALQYFLQRVNAVTAADFSAYETLLTGTRLAASLQKDETIKPHLGALCQDCATEPAVLSHWLKHNVRVRAIGNTRLRSIALRARDKVFVTDMLRALHRLSDETIRLDQRLRTDQRITYLRDALSQTASPDHRDALVALLKEQERIRMMVGIDYDFAAAAIEPPALLHRPVSPNIYIFLPLLAGLGALIGGAIGVWRR